MLQITLPGVSIGRKQKAERRKGKDGYVMNDYNEAVNKLEQLEQDPLFAEALSKASTVDEIADLLNEKGIEISPEALQDALGKENVETELDENSMENVAGGRLLISPFPRVNPLKPSLLKKVIQYLFL